MGPIEFDAQVRRLKETFGEKFYAKTRVDMIFEIAKDLPDSAVKKMVTYFIETQRQPPTPQDFRKAAYEHRRSHNLHDSVSQERMRMEASCTRCNNIGFISAVKNDGSFKALVTCTCSYGIDIHFYRKLPSTNALDHQRWTFNQLDVSWFVPTRNKHLDTDSIKKFIYHSDKVKEWSQIVHDSEDIWQKYDFNGAQ